MTITGDHASWVRRFSPADDAPVRLVCLPHAGGSASYFFPLARALAPRVDVLAIQYPGRQDRRREPCVETVPELARRIFDVLTPWTGRPVALFGHSMGAAVGFELARLIEDKAGVVPAHLFASGRRAPSTPRHETVHLLDDDGLLDDVRLLSGTDAAVLDDEELLRMALPAIRADYQAIETHRYEEGTPPLRCPITVLTGDDDPKTTADEARAWSAHTRGEFAVRTFLGGHFFLAEHQQAINDLLVERLTAR